MVHFVAGGMERKERKRSYTNHCVNTSAIVIECHIGYRVLYGYRREIVVGAGIRIPSIIYETVTQMFCADPSVL